MCKKYIGLDCYIYYSSKAELVRVDECARVPLTPTEYKILSTFTDNINKPLSLDDLAKVLWGSNYVADQKDPESIKSHITRIRNKLAQIHPMLKDRLETNFGYNTYTLIIDPTDSAKTPLETSDFSQADLHQEFLSLSSQMNMLVEKLEELHHKIERARNEESSIWVRAYSAQFEATFALLMSLREEIEDKQQHTQKLFSDTLFSTHTDVLCAPNSTIEYHYDPTQFVGKEITELKSWLEYATTKTNYIETMLDEIICDYLSHNSCNSDFLQDILFDLPLTRNVAIALYRLTESFDGMLELYEVLFDKYTKFLTNREYEQLVDRAKKTWEPIIWESWGI